MTRSLNCDVVVGRPLTTHTSWSADGPRPPRPFRSVRVIFAASVVSGELGTLEVGGTTDYAQWIDLAALDDLRGSETMGTILVLGGIAGILSSWNGFLIGASRLIYARAESGMLPAGSASCTRSTRHR